MDLHGKKGVVKIEFQKGITGKALAQKSNCSARTHWELGSISDDFNTYRRSVQQLSYASNAEKIEIPALDLLF
jgi:hypothetical protein